MFRSLFPAVVVLILMMSVSVYAQTDSGLCGDIDNSGELSLGDLTSLMAYLFNGEPISPYENRADCDGKKGITFADLMRFRDHLWDRLTPLDCVADGDYSNTVAMTDTVFMPMADCIPADSTRITLTLRIRIHDDRHSSILLPIDPLESGSNGVFLLDAINELPYDSRADGIVVLSTSTRHHDSIDFRLNYVRTGEGHGRIHTGLRDIDAGLRYVIVSDLTSDEIDLHRPVVVHEWQNDYPSGDLDCDCSQSLADLVHMISGLFISLEWPEPCRCRE